MQRDNPSKTAGITIRLTEEEQIYLKKLALRHGNDDKSPWEYPKIYVVERYREEFIVNHSRRAWRDNDKRYRLVICNTFETLIENRRRDGENLPRFDDIRGTTVNGIRIYNPETYCEAFGIPAVSGRLIKYSQDVTSSFIKEEAETCARTLQNTCFGDFRVCERELKGYRQNEDMLIFRRLLMKIGRRIINEGVSKK